jgi:hypothetical protein
VPQIACKKYVQARAELRNPEKAWGRLCLYCSAIRVSAIIPKVKGNGNIGPISLVSLKGAIYLNDDFLHFSFFYVIEQINLCWRRRENTVPSLNE